MSHRAKLVATIFILQSLSTFESASGTTYRDPHSYCRAVGTVDKPDRRYVGPKEPKAFRDAFELGDSGFLEWRCMDGSVFACGSGNSPICHKMSPYENISAIKQHCRLVRDGDVVGASVTGRFPVTWGCRKGLAYIKDGDFRIDKRGYPVRYWQIMWAQ
jgi:hypothetical protein